MTFRRFIIIRNPISTNARTVSRRIAGLQRAFPEAEYIIVETVPGGSAANAEILRAYADKLGGDMLLCIAAGDGTVNMILELLLHDPAFSAEARRTPILPLWGGNANDLAHMLNGPAHQANMTKLVYAGVIVKVYPLVCTMQGSDGDTVTRQAACYISFGASAATAEVLGKAIRKRYALDRFPPFRFVRELRVVIPAMRRAPTFMAREAGMQKAIYEYIFFKGSRFAKVSGVKRRLTDRTFHRVLVEHKRVTDVMRFMSALTRRKQAAQFESTHAAFTVLDATWMQLDGEVVRIQPNTDITIGIAKRPFYALSTHIPATELADNQ